MLAAALLVSLLCASVDHFFPEPRLALGDLMIKLLPPRPMDSRIAMANLERWPMPRRELARTVTAVARLKPAVIALDVLLDDGRDLEEDQVLARVIGGAGNVVLPVEVKRTGAATRPISLLPAMQNAAAAVGSANFFLDTDGVVRRTPVNPSGEGALPSFPEATRRIFHERAKPGTDPPAGPIERLTIDWTTMVPNNHTLLSCDALLRTSAYAKGLEKLGTVRGRIVVIGYMGERSSSDAFRTPLSEGASDGVPGVLVHANALSNLLQGRGLKTLPAPIAWVLVLASALAGAALGRSGVALSRMAMLTALLILAGLAQYTALQQWRLVASAAPIGYAAIGSHLLTVLFTARVLQRMEFIRRVFSLFGIEDRGGIVTLNIISELRDDEEELRYVLQLIEGEGAGRSVSRFTSVADPEDRLEIAGKLEDALRGNDNLPPEAALQEIGDELTAVILGRELEVALTALEASHLHLELMPEDLTLPWEMARVEGQALAERLPMSRSLVLEGGLPRISTTQRNKGLNALLVANPLPLPPEWPELTAAQEEAATLERELEQLARTSGVPVKVELLCGEAATLDAVTQRLASGRFDLLHYSGHSLFQAGTPEEAGLLLAGGTLSPALLEEIGGTAPLPQVVFANACGTGRSPDPGETGPGYTSPLSLPWSFVSRGVRMYIGTLWSIETEAAVNFALGFSRSLLAGEPAGRALRQARSEAANYWMTHAGYVLYGDPRFQLRQQVGRGKTQGESR